MMPKNAMRIGIAIIILAVLVSVFNPLAYANQLMSAAPVLVGLSIVGIAASMGLNAWAYHSILVRKHSISFIETFRTFVYGWAAESLLPGKLGSFSVAWWWKEKGIPLIEGLSTVLVYRIIVGIVTLVVGVVGALWVFPIIQLPLEWIILVLVGMVGTAYYGLYSKAFPRLVERVFPSLRTHMQAMRVHVREISSNKGIGIMLILNALIQLAVNSWVFHTMFLAVGFHAPIEAVMVATALVQLAALIPISINGLGIREGLMAVILSEVGVPPALTAGIAVVNTATGYVVTFLISIVWARKVVVEK